MSFFKQLVDSFNYKNYKNLVDVESKDYRTFLLGMGTFQYLFSLIFLAIVFWILFDDLAIPSTPQLIFLILLFLILLPIFTFLGLLFYGLIFGFVGFVLNIFIKTDINFSKLQRLAVYSIPLISISIILISILLIPFNYDGTEDIIDFLGFIISVLLIGLGLQDYKNKSVAPELIASEVEEIKNVGE